MTRPKIEERFPDLAPFALGNVLAGLWHDMDDAKKAAFDCAKDAEFVICDADDDEVDAVRRQHMGVSDARAFAAALDDDDDDETE